LVIPARFEILKLAVKQISGEAFQVALVLDLQQLQTEASASRESSEKSELQI